MTVKRLVRAASLVAVLGTLGNAFAQKDGQESKGDDLENTDNISIARMLYADGFYDRASATLSEVDPEDEAVNALDYWVLRGLVSLKRTYYAEAAEYFGEAIKVGDVEPRIHLLRAKAQVQSQDLEGAVKTFEDAPDRVYRYPEAFLLQADVLRKLEGPHEAFEILDAGFRVHEDSEELERQRLLMLIELDLFQAARDAARAFFERRDTRPTDWVALAEAMRQSGQLERAVLLLEEANLRFPNNPDIRSQLAASYLSQDRPTTAAEVLRPLAWANPEKALSTAELYLKGGAPERAISMNQRVPDQKDKFRQRLAILLDQEQYELAANLYPRLARLGLLEDEQILYALAYALYQTREFEKSEELLSQIQDPSLYRQGVQIRQAIEQCRAEPTRC